MAASAELSILIRARDEATATLGRIKGGLGAIGGAAKTAAIGIGVATAGVGALAVVGLSFAKAAAAEQASVARLDQAIRNAGGAIDENIEKSKEAVRAGERLAFSDDQIRSGLALLVAQTGDYEEAQRRMVIAQELARGANLDLELASRLVGKITEENVQVLKRYGITLRDGATEQEALAEIQKRFGGQAEAFAKTGQGAWERFNNEVQNVKESIGTALLPALTRGSTALADFLAEHQDEIEEMSNLWADRLAGAVDIVGSKFTDLPRELLPVKLFFQQLALAAVAGFEPVLAVLDAIGNFKIDLPLGMTIEAHASAIAKAHDEVRESQRALEDQTADTNAQITLYNLGLGDLALHAPDASSALDFLLAIVRNSKEPTVSLGQSTGSLVENLDRFNASSNEMKKAALWKSLVPIAEAMTAIRSEAGGTPEQIDLITAAIQRLADKRDLLGAQGLAFQFPARPTGGITAEEWVGGQFAHGGMVPGPFGAPRLIVAHGGEEVLTRQQQNGRAGSVGGGGGISITNHFQIMADMTDAAVEKMIRRVTEAQDAALRRTYLQGSSLSRGVFSP